MRICIYCHQLVPLTAHLLRNRWQFSRAREMGYFSTLLMKISGLIKSFMAGPHKLEQVLQKTGRVLTVAVKCGKTLEGAAYHFDLSDPISSSRALPARNSISMSNKKWITCQYARCIERHITV